MLGRGSPGRLSRPRRPPGLRRQGACTPLWRDGETPDLAKRHTGCSRSGDRARDGDGWPAGDSVPSGRRGALRRGARRHVRHATRHGPHAGLHGGRYPRSGSLAGLGPGARRGHRDDRGELVSPVAASGRGGDPAARRAPRLHALGGSAAHGQRRLSALLASRPAHQRGRRVLRPPAGQRALDAHSRALGGGAERAGRRRDHGPRRVHAVPGRRSLGRRVAPSGLDEIAVRRQSERAGEVVVHFPREDYCVIAAG
jgi:hypothetical protein